MSFSEIYYGCGVTFESEIPLPGVPSAAERRPAVHVVLGTIPSESRHELSAENWFHADHNSLQFLIPGVGQFRVTEGREILVEPFSTASETDLRLSLTGPAFGALLHQRGVLPLCASSIRVDDSYVAFVGKSGIGKSTQAAMLHTVGFPLAGDDVCPVSVINGKDVNADLGFTRVKLWPDKSPEGMERLDFDHDKCEVPAIQLTAGEARPLAAIYVIEDADESNLAEIIQVKGQSCLPLMLRNTYRYCFADSLGCTETYFCNCLDLARSVPIYRLRRHRGVDRFSATVALLTQHWELLGIRQTNAVA